MNFKQILQDYFTFSRNERRGIVILMLIIFLLAIANKVFFYFETPSKFDAVLFDSAKYELGLMNDSLNEQISGKRLFAFNPNSIDSASLSDLDIPESVKHNLLKFRSKGGKIRSVTDFGKIYGVTEPVCLKIKPYLQFDEPDIGKSPVKSSPEYFFFDPNAASDLDFHRLGITERQIRTIRNYQQKGGVFHRKADFLKIYGLTDSQKNELSDYIRIAEKEVKLSDQTAVAEVTTVELNTADSTELELLPGIGNKLAMRIVKYRNMLGGFYSLSQLKEVYGLNDETIRIISPSLTIDLTKVKKIDWNFADAFELSKHPYLRGNLSKQIVKFRSKYGSFRNLGVLRDSMILNIAEYNRLKPYF
jgi:competence ComEA-like helix-hairpin-helix protein